MQSTDMGLAQFDPQWGELNQNRVLHDRDETCLPNHLHWTNLAQFWGVIQDIFRVKDLDPWGEHGFQMSSIMRRSSPPRKNMIILSAYKFFYKNNGHVYAFPHNLL